MKALLALGVLATASASNCVWSANQSPFCELPSVYSAGDCPGTYSNYNCIIDANQTTCTSRTDARWNAGVCTSSPPELANEVKLILNASLDCAVKMLSGGSEPCDASCPARDVAGKQRCAPPRVNGKPTDCAVNQFYLDYERDQAQNVACIPIRTEAECSSTPPSSESAAVAELQARITQDMCPPKPRICTLKEQMACYNMESGKICEEANKSLTCIKACSDDQFQSMCKTLADSTALVCSVDCSAGTAVSKPQQPTPAPTQQPSTTPAPTAAPGSGGGEIKCIDQNALAKCPKPVNPTCGDVATWLKCATSACGNTFVNQQCPLLKASKTIPADCTCGAGGGLSGVDSLSPSLFAALAAGMLALRL